MDSKLPVETLGKIWDLADQDKDGMLDRHEFIAVSLICIRCLIHIVYIIFARTIFYPVHVSSNVWNFSVILIL